MEVLVVAKADFREEIIAECCKKYLCCSKYNNRVKVRIFVITL